MRSRYIKALLILLATTGVETQVITFALKASVGEFAVTENLSQSEFRTLRADILSVVNALKNLNSHKGNDNVYHPNGYGFASRNILLNTPKAVLAHNIFFDSPRFLLAVAGKSIRIRAPSHYLR